MAVALVHCRIGGKAIEIRLPLVSQTRRLRRATDYSERMIIVGTKARLCLDEISVPWTHLSSLHRPAMLFHEHSKFWRSTENTTVSGRRPDCCDRGAASPASSPSTCGSPHLCGRRRCRLCMWKASPLSRAWGGTPGPSLSISKSVDGGNLREKTITHLPSRQAEAHRTDLRRASSQRLPVAARCFATSPDSAGRFR